MENDKVPQYNVQSRDSHWYRENTIAIYLGAVVVIGMIATVILSRPHP